MKASVRALLFAIFGTASWHGLLAQSPLTPDLEAAAGGNSQLLGLAGYIGDVCPKLVAAGYRGTATAQGDLQRRCAAALNGSVVSKGAANQALGQIAPEQIIGQDAVISGSVARNTGAISSRLAAMSRFGGAGQMVGYLTKPVQLAELEGDAPSAAAGSLSSSKRLQAFGTFSYSGGHQDTTALETGFGIDFKSAVAGFDYRFSSTVTAGLSFGYGHTTLDFRQDAGSLKSRALTIGAYTLIEASDRLELTGLFAYNGIRYHSRRVIDYMLPADTVSTTAMGSTDARQLEVQAGATYNLGHGAWTWGPAMQLDWSRLSIDDFDESDADGLGFAFPDQHATSFLIAVGVDVSKAISTSSAILQPYARARAIFEAADGRRSIDIRYVADTVGGIGTTLRTTATDRSRFALGGGLNAQFARGFSAFADAQTLVGLAHVSQYTLSAGLRLEL